MANEAYLALQNSTALYGIATENEHGYPITLTEEMVGNIAKAFCVWLISHTGKVRVSVAVGYDSRTSSPLLCEAAVNGILSTGHDAVVTDISTTPSMLALLTDEVWQERYPSDGSMMVTAGQLPAEYNGLKLFFRENSLSAADVSSILAIANTYRYAKPYEDGNRTKASYLDRYAQRLVNTVRAATDEETPLLNKKIIVDAGNGVGGFFVEKVLKPLGANTVGSQALEPNGCFPYAANSTAIEALQATVKEVGAELGILFDADASCAYAVDHEGGVFGGNRLIALLSASFLTEGQCTVVTDPLTSNGLTQFIEARGGVHQRYIRGMKNLIDAAVRSNAFDEYTPLVAETNGRAALLKNRFAEDGAYLAAYLLITLVKAGKQGQRLAELVADLQESKEAMAVQIPLLDYENARLNGGRLLNGFCHHAYITPYITAEENNYDGYRVNYDEKHGDGWALLCTEPNAPTLSLYLESDREHGALKIAKDVYYFLRKSPCVDVAPLQAAIEAERKRLIANIRKDFYTDAAYLTFIFGEKVIVQKEELETPVSQSAETELIDETAILNETEQTPSNATAEENA